jgi:hypothetical protein
LCFEGFDLQKPVLMCYGLKSFGIMFTSEHLQAPRNNKQQCGTNRTADPCLNSSFQQALCILAFSSSQKFWTNNHADRLYCFVEQSLTIRMRQCTTWELPSLLHETYSPVYFSSAVDAEADSSMLTLLCRFCCVWRTVYSRQGVNTALVNNVVGTELVFTVASWHSGIEITCRSVAPHNISSGCPV